jgi:hypothetical protein
MGEWWMGFGGEAGGFCRWEGRVGGDGLLGRRGPRPDVVVRWESGPFVALESFSFSVTGLVCQYTLYTRKDPHRSFLLG